MADFTWPDDLVPHAMSFYHQHNTIVHESPFTRQQQVLGRSAPRWICKMSFRGGAGGVTRSHEVGAKIEALLLQIKGPQKTVAIYDFRRSGRGAPQLAFDDYAATIAESFFDDGTGFDDDTGFVVTPVGAPSNSAISAGSTQIALSGIWPGTRPNLVGDYVDVGDGRPHMITDVPAADIDGNLVLTFAPPAAAAAAASAVSFEKVRGTFRLTSDDAGQNPTDVSGMANFELDFIEVLT